jgi:hypothetical protein
VKKWGISGSNFFKDNKHHACPNIVLNVSYGLHYESLKLLSGQKMAIHVLGMLP